MLATLTIMLLTSCGGSYEANFPQEISEEFEENKNTDKVDTLIHNVDSISVSRALLDFPEKESSKIKINETNDPTKKKGMIYAIILVVLVYGSILFFAEIGS